MLSSLSWDYHPYTYSKNWQKLHKGQTGLVIVPWNQPVAYGVANEFRLVPQPESLRQSGSVILHRPLADVEPGGNLRIGLPLRRQLQHLTLPRRQGFVRIDWARLGLLNVSINGDLRHRRTQEASARGCLPYGTDPGLLGAAL